MLQVKEISLKKVFFFIHVVWLWYKICKTHCDVHHNKNKLILFLFIYIHFSKRFYDGNFYHGLDLLSVWHNIV